MTSLIERIGSRTVLVDACVSVRLAKALRKAGLSVRHMNEINPRMPDAHIEYLIMLPTDVLITHDTFFARFLGPKRAILLHRNDIDAIRKEEWYVQATGRSVGAKSGIVSSVLIFLVFFTFSFSVCRKIVRSVVRRRKEPDAVCGFRLAGNATSDYQSMLLCHSRNGLAHLIVETAHRAATIGLVLHAARTERGRLKADRRNLRRGKFNEQASPLLEPR
ncbi:MAG TPA: DUF5615 family PIN-like protein [Nitrososphaera sp.]|jgi:hypothetical protein